MLTVALIRELSGLLAEVAEWREVGHAIKRLEARYPGLEADIAGERARVRAEAAAAKPAEPQPEPPAAG